MVFRVLRKLVQLGTFILKTLKVLKNKTVTSKLKTYFEKSLQGFIKKTKALG